MYSCLGHTMFYVIGRVSNNNKKKCVIVMKLYIIHGFYHLFLLFLTGQLIFEDEKQNGIPRTINSQVAQKWAQFLSAQSSFFSKYQNFL